LKVKIYPSLLILSLLFVIFFPGCNDSLEKDELLHGSGKIVSQTRTLEECSGVILQNTGNIYLTQADTQSIRIEADDNIIDRIETEVDGEKLEVGLNKGSYENITCRIYVSLKKINKMLINGSGNIVTDNVKSDEVYCKINGSGNINIKGSGNYIDLYINGSGNISAQEFTAKKCKAYINGSGNITLYASEEADTEINGSGNIFFSWNPSGAELGKTIKK
jgi:hypothetical protein